MTVTAEQFAAIPATPAQPRPSLEGERFDPQAVGYALSGGGYKAALFHLGGLIRLNELGWLSRIDRFSSVSGGSIVAALLALKWPNLDWQGGVARTLIPEVAAPLAEFCATANIDEPSILEGLLPFTDTVELLAGAYDKHLFKGATLQHLTDEGEEPRFVFNAVNFELDSLWRMSRAYVADWRIGLAKSPDFSLARVVAASSGFPPFFCPVQFDLSKLRFDTTGADRTVAPYNQRALMADGGIYDNMGLEAVWKRCGVLLVSNAGDPIKETDLPHDWAGKLQRVIGLIHRQAENNRVRWLMEEVAANPQSRRLAYWPGRSTVGRLAPGLDLPSLSPEEAYAAATEEVRLRPLPPDRINRLVQHGYCLANAVAYVRLGAQGPAHLPKII